MKKLLLCYSGFLLSFSLTAQINETPTPQWRPLYHFTPEKYWTNDPNGLIYINGVYNLYNQQNPFENKWGHMSWGHATSTDLVHWKYLPVAIPETISGDDTVWRFSGSTVWDKNNTSKWCKNNSCIVAVYTAHQPHIHNESQYVAYSNDGGITFTNYQQNPVIDLQKQDFRDPNVFWYEPGKFWLMTVVLPAEHKAQFYSSLDLKSWGLLSEFGPQGYVGANWECPFLIQLNVEDTDEKKWVLVTSAAGGQRGVYEQYFIGEFDGKEFKNDNAPDKVLTLDYGDTYYAAIPWNNLPGDKKTFIGWMVPNPQQTSPWKGQMSVARDLSLRETKDGLKLIQKPTSLIEENLDQLSNNKITELKNFEINNKEMNLGKDKIKENAYWIKAELTLQPGATTGFKIAQKTDATGKVINETVIGYNASKHQLYVDRTNTGGGKLDENALKRTVDLTETSNKIRFEILMDKSSLEVFANNGEAVITTYIYPAEGADNFAVFSTGKTIINNLKIWDLSSVKP